MEKGAHVFDISPARNVIQLACHATLLIAETFSAVVALFPFGVCTVILAISPLNFLLLLQASAEGKDGSRAPG